jgi:hypothetical protein
LVATPLVPEIAAPPPVLGRADDPHPETAATLTATTAAFQRETLKGHTLNGVA